MRVEKKAKEERRENRKRRRKEKDQTGDSISFLLASSEETLPFFSMSTSLIFSSFSPNAKVSEGCEEKKGGQIQPNREE